MGLPCPTARVGSLGEHETCLLHRLGRRDALGLRALGGHGHRVISRGCFGRCSFTFCRVDGQGFTQWGLGLR